MRVRTLVLAGCVAGAACLAACGGGAPAAVPVPVAATASASAAASAAAAYWSGSVTAAGATIRLGTSFAGGAVDGVVARATSAPDGSFAMTVPLAAALPVVAPPAVATLPPDVAIPGGFGASYPQPPPLPPGTTAMFVVQIDAAGFAPLHRIAYLQPGIVRAAPYVLAAVTADDLAALAAVNADRAAFGSGAGRNPLGLDSDLERAGRFATATMAALGFYAHDYPGTSSFVSFSYWCAIDALCGRDAAIPAYGENQAAAAVGNGPASLVAAEAAYVAEGPSGSHFRAVVDANDVWVGFGETFGGACDPALAPLPHAMCDYFAEEFAAR